MRFLVLELVHSKLNAFVFFKTTASSHNNLDLDFVVVFERRFVGSVWRGCHVLQLFRPLLNVGRKQQVVCARRRVVSHRAVVQGVDFVEGSAFCEVGRREFGELLVNGELLYCSENQRSKGNRTHF